ncbi:uncharacterized protein LOC134406018 [Elgaria multicarinata webbii]|uniref:uncharacterized protein LOC134406018 n=1 Tax=Elgaria multicarinata webbii TaxID=159646 RepID=UPI002FCCC052
MGGAQKPGSSKRASSHRTSLQSQEGVPATSGRWAEVLARGKGRGAGPGAGLDGFSRALLDVCSVQALPLSLVSRRGGASSEARQAEAPGQPTPSVRGAPAGAGRPCRRGAPSGPSAGSPLLPGGASRGPRPVTPESPAAAAAASSSCAVQAAGASFTFADGRLPTMTPTLLLLALLLPRPALGNVGGTAGSCECVKHKEAPEIVKRFPERLQTWEICRDFVRFTFKQQKVCGLIGVEWVVNLQKTHPAKRKGGGHAPTPTPRVPLTSPPPLSLVTVRDVLVKTTGTQPVQGVTTDPALALGTPGRSTAAPRSGAAGAGPSHFPQQAEAARGTKAAVISLLGVALVSVAVTVAMVCRRRRQRWGRPLAPCVPLEVPGEEALSLRLEET